MGSRLTLPYPLVLLSLAEVCRQPELGDEGQGLSDAEVWQQAVILAHVGDVLPHQLRCAVPPVDQNLTRLDHAALVTARYDVQQRGLAAAWG